MKRNQERFPDDFMFQLTWNEAVALRSQFVTLKKGNLMMRYFLLFFVLLSPPLLGLDWDKEKYLFPEEDSNWLSQVQPDTDEFSEISMAAKRQVLKRMIEEKKETFLKLIERAGNFILNQNSLIVDEKYLKEWHLAFISAQKLWLAQLELEATNHLYQERALGGNGSDTETSYFIISLLDQRIENIKNQWWLKDAEKFSK